MGERCCASEGVLCVISVDAADGVGGRVVVDDVFCEWFEDLLCLLGLLGYWSPYWNDVMT